MLQKNHSTVTRGCKNRAKVQFFKGAKRHLACPLVREMVRTVWWSALSRTQHSPVCLPASCYARNRYWMLCPTQTCPALTSSVNMGILRGLWGRKGTLDKCSWEWIKPIGCYPFEQERKGKPLALSCLDHDDSSPANTWTGKYCFDPILTSI